MQNWTYVHSAPLIWNRDKIIKLQKNTTASEGVVNESWLEDKKLDLMKKL